MSASLDRRSAVLTIGGIPLSRVTVCRSGSVDYAAVSDRGGWPKGVREKGWSCARDTASCRSSWKQHFLGKEPREGQWCANLPLREEVEVCVQLGRRVVDLFGGGRGTTVCGLIEKRCFRRRCVVCCWSFFRLDSVHLSFPLRKYFCLLRVYVLRLKRSCGICAVRFATLWIREMD